MYIILEIQTNADGTVGTIVNTREDRLEAQSVYHQVLASAAISAVPIHACTMLDSTGRELMHEHFIHGQLTPEEEEATDDESGTGNEAGH